MIASVEITGEGVIAEMRVIFSDIYVDQAVALIVDVSHAVLRTRSKFDPLFQEAVARGLRELRRRGQTPKLSNSAVLDINELLENLTLKSS